MLQVCVCILPALVGCFLWLPLMCLKAELILANNLSGAFIIDALRLVLSPALALFLPLSLSLGTFSISYRQLRIYSTLCKGCSLIMFALALH